MAFVHFRRADLLVTAVDVADVARMKLRLGRDAMRDHGTARLLALVVARSMPCPAVVEHGGTRRDLDGDDVIGLDAGRFGGGAQIAQRILARMELFDRRCYRPAVRAPDIFDRALVSLGVV